MADDHATEGLLERADELDALAGHLAAVGAEGRGRLVLVAGEAGIGKTALVRAFCERAARGRVLWGACDALFTPRPLGPIVDIADEVGGELEALVAQGAAPGELVAALARELRGRPPDVLVLDDLHWADEATLDVLRLLARRIESLPALVLATYRDDEIDPRHPLRIVLGELPGRSAARMALAPLSARAVAELAGSLGVDHDELHRTTAGNPFYVTEVLAAAGGDIPVTVRDAVLARAARMDEGPRALLDAVAIAPLRAELWLLDALADGQLDGLDACLASGMLRGERDAVRFRHEIARVAVEEALAPHRAWRSIARRSPRSPRTATAPIPRGSPTMRRPPTTWPRSCATPPPRASARRCSSPTARPPRSSRAPCATERTFLASAGRSCSSAAPTSATSPTTSPARSRLAAWRSTSTAPPATACGRATPIAGCRAWSGSAARTPSPRRRRGARSSCSSRSLPAASWRWPTATWRSCGCWPATSPGRPPGRPRDRAGRAPRRTEIVVHALNNVGAAELEQGMAEGAPKLERSLELALEADLEEHVARAYTNLGAGSIAVGEYARGDRYLDAGIAYCVEHDLDSWFVYMTGWRARSELDQGRWDAAGASATEVVLRPNIATPTRITPLAVLGSLRARRGDPDPWVPLDEALELARGTGEVQRLALVAAARAEARWLAGESEEIAAETDAALALGLRYRHRWLTGQVAVWRRRAGLADEIDPDAVVEPHRLELEGAPERAAERWAAIGCPYEAALALVHAEDDGVQRRGLGELQRLGAHAAARRVARALRERGVRDVRRGPRAATRENPAGLTARELEVVALVAEGLRNAEIAGRLFVSEKTVAHHVSAILRKLDVGTRSQAGAEAARLGIVER